MIFHCKDLGYDCSWQIEGKTVDELMPQIKEHAAEVHALTHFKPEAEQNVREVLLSKQ